MVRKLDKLDEMPTTGHEWDGIREYDTPMPRWWVWTFYGTIVWSIGMVIAYPAIPLINGATPGILDYSTRAEVQKEIDAAAEANAPLYTRLEETPLAEIAQDEELASLVANSGPLAFSTYCAQCHGTNKAGGPGYPNLLDDAWLWGGDIEAIHQTIAHGIRDESDPETRFSEMPAFGDNWLEREQIAQVTEYVLKISGNEHDAAMAEAGAETFAAECTACHGENGQGDQAMGAPNLTDAVWLYGGDRETVIASITNGRAGMMPAWAERLEPAQVRLIAAYVHQLGGGE